MGRARTPTPCGIVPNIVEKWDQNADATEYTFYLRKGIKWSDGKEVTTEDVKLLLRGHGRATRTSSRRPTPRSRQRIGDEWKIATLNVVDKYTFKVQVRRAQPAAADRDGQDGRPAASTTPPGFVPPSHYLKQFHPKYANVDELEPAGGDQEAARLAGPVGHGGDLEGPIVFWFVNPDVPVLDPWKTTVPAPADPNVMERNPYYWQVDSDGNQLPYIDRVEHSLFENHEVLNLWVAQGRIDMQMRHMSAGNYTFYKENEAEGQVPGPALARGQHRAAYFPNINARDKVLAKIFDTPDGPPGAQRSRSTARRSTSWSGTGWASRARPRR